MDNNSDGVISKEEFCYANVDFNTNSGPENFNSLFFGNLPEDD